MAANRRNPLNELEDKYGISVTDDEIKRGIERDNAIVAELVKRSPFLPHERGWYLWIAWAKMKVHGKRNGCEPTASTIETKISGVNHRIEYGPFKIYRFPRVPKKHARL